MITGHDIIGLGFKRGGIGVALAKAHVLEVLGWSKDAILADIVKDLPAPIVTLSLRKVPSPFSEAVLPADEVEASNVESVRGKMNELLVSPVIELGAVMPDCCPAGAEPATIPVGGAIAVRNAIVPGAHSADISCSMFATFFEPKEDTSYLLDKLMAVTRFGAGGRRDHELVHHPILDEDIWKNPFLNGLKSYGVRHMADQGDGNHFAYIGRLSDTDGLAVTLAAAGYGGLADSLRGRGELWCLVTHHGSRGLGAQLYKRGIDAAVKYCAEVCPEIPRAAAWLDVSTDEGAAYWEALQYIGRWTRANHESIHQLFVKEAGLAKVASFGNEHNFVWKRGDMFYHGKGATPAWKDDDGRPLLGLIPLNMAAPILVVLGKDNQEFLSFAPHGAGRNRSRTATTKPFRDDSGNLMETAVRKAIARETDGLDIRWFCGRPDVSESPLGYKDATAVTKQIAHFGLADVAGIIEPMGCIMAGDQPKPWEHGKKSKKEIRAMGHRADRRADKAALKDFR